MKNDLSYRGYQTTIDFSAEDGCFVGHLAGIPDIVGFHGETMEEAAQDFHAAVDSYLESLAKAGEAPPAFQLPCRIDTAAAATL